MIVVVDASILLALGLADEPFHSQAQRALMLWHAAEVQLAAPRLFRSEITAVVRKVVYQERMTVEQGRAVLSQLLSYPVTLYEDVELLKAAFELALRFNHPRTYDAQYMALAERLDCIFWTLDERLFNGVRSEFQRIRWLGDDDSSI